MKKTILLILIIIPFFVTAQQWTKLDCGTEYSVAIKSDGTLWSWGFNGNGQLGQGNMAQLNVPTQIGTATNWKDVATGAFHCLAVKTDGTLWAWGLNGQGQVGNGNLIQQTSPVQVGTDTDWDKVEAGMVHSFAIKNSKTLWAWGWNQDGQLGIGTNVDANMPIQVGTNSDWEQISAGGAHTLGLRTNGTLWAWGFNLTGQLGNGTTTNKNTPIQVGAATDWAQVSAGFEFSLARKNNSTVWSWGFNGNSQLGDDGLGTQQLSPVQFDTGSDWKKIEAGATFGFAIKNNNTLYAWGYNGYGQLGVANTTQQDQAVQVGTDTDWDIIAGAEGANLNNSILGVHALSLKIGHSAICAAGGNYVSQLGNGTIVDEDIFNCNVGVLNVGIYSNSNKNGYLIYPNPTSGFIQIRSYENADELQSVRLYSYTGKLIKEITHRPHDQLDFSYLASGIYLVELVGRDRILQRERLVLD